MDYRDLAERAGWTWIEGFTGTLVASAVLDLGVSSIEAAAVAGLAGVLALLKVTAQQRLAR